MYMIWYDIIWYTIPYYRCGCGQAALPPQVGGGGFACERVASTFCPFSQCCDLILCNMCIYIYIYIYIHMYTFPFYACLYLSLSLSIYLYLHLSQSSPEFVSKGSRHRNDVCHSENRNVKIGMEWQQFHGKNFMAK